MRKKICEHHYDVNDGKKVYIKDSKFMEFVDEMATQLTELNFHDETFVEVQDGLSDGTCIVFTEDAQDFYNERYDEIETMVNNMMGVYRYSTFTENIFNPKGKKSC